MKSGTFLIAYNATHGSLLANVSSSLSQCQNVIFMHFYFLFPDICQPTFSKLFHIRRVFAPPQMCYTDLCKVLLKQFQARNRRQAWARTHGGTDRLQTPRPIGASATPMGRCDKMTDKILKLHQCSPQQTKMHPHHSAMLLESGEGK